MPIEMLFSYGRSLPIALAAIVFFLTACGEAEGLQEGWDGEDPYRTEASLTDPPPGGNEPVEAYFEHEHTIRLSEEVLVGSIRHLDVDPDGRLLITDDTGGEVFLFDREGNHLKTLDPEPCHPGFNWRPIEARFAPDGRILLTNGGPWGFLFDSDGSCLEAVHEEFRPPAYFDFGPDGTLYASHRRTDPRGHYVQTYSFEGEPLEQFGHGARQKNFISRLTAGGLAVAEGFVFTAIPSDPHIFKFTADGAFIGKIGWRPGDYRPVEGDMPNVQRPADILEASRSLREGKSITGGLFVLDDELLLFRYSNLYEDNDAEERTGFYVVRADGEPVTRGVFHMDNPFFFAKDGYAYRRGERELEDGYLENPYLEVYRFKSE